MFQALMQIVSGFQNIVPSSTDINLPCVLQVKGAKRASMEGMDGVN